MATRIDSIKGVKTIRKADGSLAYQITVSKGIDSRTGRQKRRYKTFTPSPDMTKNEIAAEIEQIRVDLGSSLVNGNTMAGKKSFFNYANEYIDKCETSGKFKRRTAVSYRYLLEVIADDFGNLPLNAIMPETIDAFMYRLLTNNQ